MAQNGYVHPESGLCDGLEVHGVKFEGEFIYENNHKPDAYAVYRTSYDYIVSWIADFDSKTTAIGYANAYAKAYGLSRMVVK